MPKNELCTWRAASEPVLGNENSLSWEDKTKVDAEKNCVLSWKSWTSPEKAVPWKSFKITFRTGKSSESSKLILLSFDHKQKTWKMPSRLLLRTVQCVELAAAADHMHFVALRKINAVRLDCKRCNHGDKRRSCAIFSLTVRQNQQISTAAITNRRSAHLKQTKSLRNAYSSIPHFSGCWCQPSSRRKVSVDKTCFCFDTCHRRVFDQFLNSTEMRAWTTKPKILSARIIACEISLGIPWTAAHICCHYNKPWESHSNGEQCRKRALETFRFVFMQIAQKWKC